MEGTTLLERYRVSSLLGQGGRGAVYSAEDLLLGREVAVKTLLPESMTPESRERFRYEARTTAKLTHPAIASVYDFGEQDEVLFIVMPVIQGQTLRGLMEDGALDASLVIEIAIQVADALDYSHTQGIIHRDVKPENIMVERPLTGRAAPGRLQVKVLDFGLATDVQERRLRESGEIYGTVLYISPEQLIGEAVDPRTDIYSLGMVLYECLAGRHPLKEGEGAIFKRILLQSPLALREFGVEISESLEGLIMSCVAKERECRPANALDVLRALRKAREIPGLRSDAAWRIENDVDGAFDEPVSFADRLGDILLVKGEYLDAQDAYRKAREKRRTAAGCLAAGTEARYLLKLGQLGMRLGRYEEALGRCQQGLELARPHHPLIAAELAALAGLVCCMRGRYDEAAKWVDRGCVEVGRAEVGGEDTRLVEVVLLRTQGNLFMGVGEASQALDAYQRSLELGEELDDRWERSIGLFNVGEALLDTGVDEQASEFLSRAVEEKSAIGDRWGLAYAHHSLARLHLRCQDLDRALEEAQTGLRLATEITDPKIASRLSVVLGRIHLERGENGRATNHFRAALREAERIASEPDAAQARAGLEAVWIELGIDGEAFG